MLEMNLKKGTIKAAVVTKNYNAIAHISWFEKEGIILNLLFHAYIISLEIVTLLGGKKIQEFKAYGNKHIIGSFYAGNYHISYISTKGKEKELEELFSKISRFGKR